MFSNFLAQHQPYLRDFGAVSAAPAPSITPSPAPPQEEPITFAAVSRASLFGIVGDAIASTTLATITCADAAMTVELSHTVSGLTFSYAANVLSVSGTPTASGFVRVVVSYISSDGNRTVRGSTSHEITVADAAEEVTVDAVYSVAGRVGFPMEAVVAEVSANYGVDLYLTSSGLAPGLGMTLDWTFDESSGDGEVVISGTPTKAATFSLDVALCQKITGIRKATFTSVAVIAAAYQPAPPAPAPSPIPPPPAPSPPPAPTPAPSPGLGGDQNLAATKVLMRFNAATGIAYDHRGNTFANSGATSTVGAVDEGGFFNSSQDTIYGTVPSLVIEDADDEHLTVECMVKIGSNALWVAVFADGVRFLPIVSCVDGGVLIWTLGFISQIEGFVVENPGRVVQPCFIARTAGTSLAIGDVTLRNYMQMALGPVVGSLPGQFMHLAGMLEHATPAKLAAWFGGNGPFSGQCATFTGTLARPSASAVVRIGSAFVPRPGSDGASLVDPSGAIVTINNMVAPNFVIDELRVKLDDHYGSLVTGTNTQADIPAASRVIPWPNY